MGRLWIKFEQKINSQKYWVYINIMISLDTNLQKNIT